MNQKQIAKKVLLITTRLMTARQWAKARTALDMSKEEILNDSDSLAVVMAWFTEGADFSKFEDYLDKPIAELESIFAGVPVDDAAWEAEVDKVLADSEPVD
ncbi:hypothetical protein [Nocardioides sp. Leaf307]|uniref:hypothetical protein n=1 Tax=Nocardioides sp. Leaf307 TaxID=1736331 RepID=UPI0012EA4249|nr:hypothetical protein [Nocardioides sp. Leaf307]